MKDWIVPFGAVWRAEDPGAGERVEASVRPLAEAALQLFRGSLGFDFLVAPHFEDGRREPESLSSLDVASSFSSFSWSCQQHAVSPRGSFGMWCKKHISSFFFYFSSIFELNEAHWPTTFVN